MSVAVESLIDRIAHTEALRRRLQAIESELEPRDRKRLLQYAKRRVAMVRTMGARYVDDADELVADAITDTITGDRSWMPGVPIYVHLLGVLRSRTAALAAAAVRAPHASIEDDDGTLGTTPGPDVQVAARRALQDAVRWLHGNGADPEVMQVVGAYLEGARTRCEVATWTGMSVEAVTAARRRLDRLLSTMRSGQEEELSSSGTW